MKKRGFTLVELLAVIAILAILVIIALPNVIKLYNNAKKNSFLTEAKTVYSEVSKKYISESIKGNKLSYINSEDNTKLEMNGNKLKYCIQLDNNGNIIAMKVGNDNYYIFYDGSKDISKLDINDVSEGKYVQNKCDANTTITKDGTTPKPPAKACTYDGDINPGDAIQIGMYTYHYKQDYGENMNLIDITSDTFHVELTDKDSTDAVTEVPCSSINGKLVTSMATMFLESQASSIDLSNFDTSKVTNMSMMLGGIKTKKLSLSSFDTSKVTNMMGMFASSRIDELDLSSFDTLNVEDMSYMFIESSAKKIKFSDKFNTLKVKNMECMFYDSSASTLDLSSFDTSSVTNMDMMFAASEATEIKGLNKFDTSKVTNMRSMFYKSKATTLGLNSFDTSNVIDMHSMFSYSQATILDLSSFDTSNVIDMTEMFYGAEATTGYARTQTDADKLNKSSYKPSGLTFTVK